MIKSLQNSDDRADQKTGRNGDNTLGIPGAETYVHTMSMICS